MAVGRLSLHKPQEGKRHVCLGQERCSEEAGCHHLRNRGCSGHCFQGTREWKVLANSTGWAFSGYSNSGPWQEVSSWVEGYLPPSCMQSTRAGAYGTALPSHHLQDAQDGRGDGSLTLALQDFRAGIKERPFKGPSPLLWHSQMVFPAGLQAVPCRVQCQNMEEDREGRKSSFILEPRRKAIRSRVKAILPTGVVICWLFRDILSQFRHFLSLISTSTFLSLISTSTCLYPLTCTVPNQRSGFWRGETAKKIQSILSQISSKHPEGPKVLQGSLSLPIPHSAIIDCLTDSATGILGSLMALDSGPLGILSRLLQVNAHIRALPLFILFMTIPFICRTLYTFHIHYYCIHCSRAFQHLQNEFP